MYIVYLLVLCCLALFQILEMRFLLFLRSFVCSCIVYPYGAMWCPSNLQMEGFPYFKGFKWGRVFGEDFFWRDEEIIVRGNAE